MKIKNGKRIYGAWTGDPMGTPEDVTRCVEEVSSPGRWIGWHQCTRKRGHGPGGLYCKQHATKHKESKT